MSEFHLYNLFYCNVLAQRWCACEQLFLSHHCWCEWEQKTYYQSLSRLERTCHFSLHFGLKAMFFSLRPFVTYWGSPSACLNAVDLSGADGWKKKCNKCFISYRFRSGEDATRSAPGPQFTSDEGEAKAKSRTSRKSIDRHFGDTKRGLWYNLGLNFSHWFFSTEQVTVECLVHSYNSSSWLNPTDWILK